MSKDRHPSEVIPYRSFVDEEFVDLHGGGIMTGVDTHEPSPEMPHTYDLANQVRQFVATHLGARIKK
jgi:hypothetical protein